MEPSAEKDAVAEAAQVAYMAWYQWRLATHDVLMRYSDRQRVQHKHTEAMLALRNALDHATPPASTSDGERP